MMDGLYGCEVTDAIKCSDCVHAFLYHELAENIRQTYVKISAKLTNNSTSENPGKKRNHALLTASKIKVIL